MRVPSPCWYGRVGGKDVRLFENRAASESRLTELLGKHDRGQTPLAVGDSAKEPLAKHLDDWKRHLEGKGSGRSHVLQFTNNVRRVVEACAFSTPADIDADAVRHYLGELRTGRVLADIPDGKDRFTRAELAEMLGVGVQAVTFQVARHVLLGTGYGKARRYPRETAERLLALRCKGASPKTVREYTVAMRAFCRWMLENDRHGKNPLAKLKPGKGRTGDRHKRRALSRPELTRLLGATRSSARVSRRLTGEDRFWLYVVATCTGFRAGELASLTPRCFSIDGGRPFVHLSPEASKNDEGAEQPLPSVILGGLREYLAAKDPRQPVWPGSWSDSPVDILRPDLAAAKIPYVVEGPGGVPLFADMHAMRHTFVRLLDLAGTSLKEAMQLARHKDPKLTMAIYGQAGADELAAKVDAVGLECFPAASFLLPFPGATG